MGGAGESYWRIRLNNTDDYGQTKVTNYWNTGTATLLLSASTGYFQVQGFNNTAFGEDCLVGSWITYVIH